MDPEFLLNLRYNQQMELVTHNQQKISTWSGGTTTELFIYPEVAEYSERNFDFRISTATVEVEESNFYSTTRLQAHTYDIAR